MIRCFELLNIGVWIKRLSWYKNGTAYHFINIVQSKKPILGINFVFFWIIVVFILNFKQWKILMVASFGGKYYENFVAIECLYLFIFSYYLVFSIMIFIFFKLVENLFNMYRQLRQYMDDQIVAFGEKKKEAFKIKNYRN